MSETATEEYAFQHLRMRSQREGDVILFELVGSLDASNLSDFEDTVVKACNEEQPRVLIDCHGLTHISSNGIGCFYRFLHTCRANGGSFAICSVPDKVMAVLDLVGLSRVMKPARDRATGIALLAATEATA